MGSMEKRVKNIMSNMSGGDLGRLFVQDAISQMGGESRAYSAEDFDAVFQKLDWRNKNEYMNYTSLLRLIISEFLYGWWLCSAIEAVTLRLDVIIWIMRFNFARETIGESLLLQRLEYAASGGEWIDPSEDETLYREASRQLMETFLESKKDIAKLGDTLVSRVKQYLTFDKTMRVLSEMVGIPELATIIESPLHHVDALIQDIERELENLPPDSPCRKVIPDIDISTLEPDQAEVESHISQVTKLLKA